MKILASILVLTLAAASHAAPKVTFEADGIGVEGVAPGSRVAWLAVVKEPRYGYVSVRKVQGVDQITPSGKLKIDAKGFELTHAVWLLTDVETGAVVRVPVPGYVSSTRTIDVSAAKGSATFFVSATQAKLLYVRPKGGVWMTSAYDGGFRDADEKQNGMIAIALAALEPLKGNPHPPETTAAGDVILVIDTVSMRTVQVQVAP